MFPTMRSITQLLLTAVFAAAMCSCASDTASSLGFSFDTYSRFTVKGNGAVDTLEAVEASMEEMSGAFDICYDTIASELPQNSVYRDCFDKAAALNALYGDEINVCCGELTELWGISGPEPRVPSEAEISAVLDRISCESFGDFPDGMKLDFGAVSKGYACDKAYEILESTETEYAVISLSSTTLLYGEKPDGERFRAGVTDPLKGSGYMGIINTEAAFVSTSGGYERYFEAQGQRYCHILDMKTGRPVQTDLVSATVIVPAGTPNGGIMSDFLATLVFIEGPDGLDKWLGCDAFEVVAADGDGAVYSSCGGFELDESGGFYYGKR